MGENSESTNFDALIDILTSHYSDFNGKEKWDPHLKEPQNSTFLPLKA